MHIADALSRAYLSDGNDRQGQFSQINAIKHLPIGQSTLQKLCVSTDADNTMQVLKEMILNGWPDSKADVNAEISSYFAMRDELAIHDGLIFKGERMVVPQGRRKEIKQRLHQSHLGADSMVRRARVCIFWPGMSAGIKQVANDCEACQSLAKSLPKTLMPIEATRPW